MCAMRSSYICRERRLSKFGWCVAKFGVRSTVCTECYGREKRLLSLELVRGMFGVRGDMFVVRLHGYAWAEAGICFLVEVGVCLRVRQRYCMFGVRRTYVLGWVYNLLGVFSFHVSKCCFCNICVLQNRKSYCSICTRTEMCKIPMKKMPSSQYL